MNPAGTPLEALVEHAGAFSSRDNERYADNLALPFVHLWPDGSILRYESRADVDLHGHYAKAGLDARNFGHTALDEADLVLDWPDLKAFRVKFTRFAPDGAASGQSEAIWAVIREGGAWKLKSRIGAMRTKVPAS
jgi:hypothetical protein